MEMEIEKGEEKAGWKREMGRERAHSRSPYRHRRSADNTRRIIFLRM